MAVEYEYKIETSDSPGLERLLNEQGRNGWRVIAIDLKHNSDKTVIVFERQSVFIDR